MTPAALEELVVGLKDRAADALLALHSGEDTFGEFDPQTGTADRCVSFLAGAFDWLYAAKESDFCRSMVASLQSPDTTFSREMLAASLATMDGKLDQAIANYEAAALADTNAFQPLAQAAHLLVVRKRRDEAIDHYLQALKRADDPGDRIALFLQVGEEQLAAKLYDDATDSYESAVELAPELANDKIIAKSLKKARKKAGRVAAI